jgi:hypothetical protein
MQQVLLNTGYKHSRNFQHVKICFWRGNDEQNSRVKSVFKVQNWSDGNYSPLSFDVHEVLQHEVIVQRKTVNHFHAEWPWEVTWQKQPVKWYPGDWFLHYNTTPAHPSLVVQAFLTSCGMTVVVHALYPADPVHCGFFLFPSLKTEVGNEEEEMS